MATPDTPLTFEGLRKCDLTVHIATKLNRSHLVHGKALILPTLGRTEIDLQNGVPQGVTVEDSMSMVHISYGMNKPASPNLLSETAIVVAAGAGHAGQRNSTGCAWPPTTPASATKSKKCSTTFTTTTSAWPSRAASI
jgi:hypothetical protein